MNQRLNEPKDTALLAISKVLPDRWLDDHWPMRRTQGRRQPLSVSAMVRIHLLTLIKALGSFNAAGKELHHNLDFRRFCRLAAGQGVPTPSYLSRLREAMGLELWLALHRHLLQAAATLSVPSPAGLLVPDATDLPAAVRRTSKKKTSPRCPDASAKPARRAARAAARAVSPIILWATKNTASMAWCTAGTSLSSCR
jgi:hypothetical protein